MKYVVGMYLSQDIKKIYHAVIEANSMDDAKEAAVEGFTSHLMDEHRNLLLEQERYGRQFPETIDDIMDEIKNNIEKSINISSSGYLH